MTYTILNSKVATIKFLKYLYMNSLKKNYIYKICKEIKSEPSNITLRTKMLEDRKIIIKEKSGRRVYISLTEKGRELVEYLIKIERILG